MGASSSKPVRSAAQAASRRQYPKQPSPTTSAPSSAPTPPPKTHRAPETSHAGPTYHSKEQPSLVKSNAIDMDGRDPDFAASLRSIGPVNPVPTYSPTSTFSPQPSQQRGPAQPAITPASNPALLVYHAREQINKIAKYEVENIGRPSFAGRQFLDAVTIRQALSMRDRQGIRPGEIERILRLKKGVVDRLGKQGVVAELL
ncbi:hypothetical protein P170DRAFT_505365 [Aspergillus steynii IBT 23096]|uniref:Helix-turn-helix domain-containing protein n=1 Tax=Aspergillus steynii IBT 23096 TaxID=1392250 RepID=A0A2I2GP32_9EURO|nr:uncharacterized protein P170DRAFT_505365 [Aspergillus steynii IBT 23096]PLB54632.1 hypothetical protein P170DRAFT_505365 [Aspergillus steynii IBT 23096]